VNRLTDEANCGTCGTACATGATCTNGSCACPAGPLDGCQGACCAGGTSCCGSGACETEHSNGLGQHFYDCNPLYEPPSTTTQQAAQAAALAWAPAGAFDPTVFCDPSCVAIKTGAACAIWCYGQSPSAGRAKATASIACASACPWSDYAVWK
jgi:hypothetical protein